MKDKATAIAIALVVVLLMPVIASLTWLVIGGALGYVLWNRSKFTKLWADVKDVISPTQPK